MTSEPKEDQAGVWHTALWADMAAKYREHLRYFLTQVSSRASVEVALVLVGEDPDYQRIARQWDGMDTEARMEASGYLDDLARTTAYMTRPYCQRCGTCCQHAGPTLYPDDLELIRSGRLGLDRLVTHRAGTRVYSHYLDREVSLEREVVMIAPDERGGCPFLALHPTTCRIHRYLPVQCQAQQCWDTSAWEALQAKDGLMRLEIIPEGHPARALVEALEAGGNMAVLRERAAKEAGEYAGALDFLLGPKMKREP